MHSYDLKVCQQTPEFPRVLEALERDGWDILAVSSGAVAHGSPLDPNPQMVAVFFVVVRKPAVNGTPTLLGGTTGS